MIRSLSTWVLVALVAGLAVGAGLQAFGTPAMREGADFIEALGSIWLSGLRMTIIPLVFSLLVVGIASVADAASTGKLAARTIGLFVLLLLGFAIYGVLATQGFLALWPVDPHSAATLRASVGVSETARTAAPALGDWLKSLVPSNIIRSAAEDAILPVVVFGVFFGFAATRLGDDLKLPLLGLFRAISEAMLVMVRWILWAAPFGVFALSLGVGLRTGLGSAGVLAHYVIIVTLIVISVTPLMFAVLAISRATPVGRFAKALTPVLAVAFSTQSSLACLPAMLERCRDDLGVPTRVTGLVLPLAVAVFRITSPVANLAVALFVAHVYGVHPGVPQLIGATLVAFAISIGTVGLPGQISFFASIAPICLALGAPVDMLVILLAVEVIPDIFRTVGNVTADMAVTAMVGKGQGQSAAKTQS